MEDNRPPSINTSPVKKEIGGKALQEILQKDYQNALMSTDEQFRMLKKKNSEACIDLIYELQKLKYATVAACDTTPRGTSSKKDNILASAETLSKADALLRRVNLMKDEFLTDLETTESILRGEERTLNKLSQLRLKEYQQPRPSSKPEENATLPKKKISFQDDNIERQNEQRPVLSPPSTSIPKLKAPQQQYYLQSALMNPNNNNNNTCEKAIQKLHDEIRFIDEENIKARTENEKKHQIEISKLNASIAELQKTNINNQHIINALTDKMNSLSIDINAIQSNSKSGKKRILFQSGDSNQLLQNLAANVTNALTEIHLRLNDQENNLIGGKNSALPGLEKRIMDNVLNALIDRQHRALSAVEVDRQIDQAKLENKLDKIVERLNILEVSVESEKEDSIKMLELVQSKFALLKSSAAITPGGASQAHTPKRSILSQPQKYYSPVTVKNNYHPSEG